MGINIGLHHFTVAYTTILSRLLFYTIFKNAFLPSPRGCCPRCSFSCTPGIRPQAIRCHSKQRRPGSWCPGDCGVCLQPGQGPGQRRCCCHWRCHCPAGKEERRPRGPRPYLLVELESASGEARCSCPHQGSYHHCCPCCQSRVDQPCAIFLPPSRLGQHLRFHCRPGLCHRNRAWHLLRIHQP